MKAVKMKVLKLAIYLGGLAALCLSLTPFSRPAFGSADDVLSTSRFILHLPSNPEQTRGLSVPPRQMASVALEVLEKTHNELKVQFDFVPQKRAVLRFVSPAEFKRITRAPSWTSAMYYKGEIIVPVSPDKAVDIEDLKRTLRHEFVHAFVAELSNQSCPAWLDEGLAQMIEGDANPYLADALNAWIKSNEALPLSSLQRGFTRMTTNKVPVAYGQSLFAARALVRRYGYKAMGRYLALRGQGFSDVNAFKEAFGIGLPEFQAWLTPAMRNQPL